ncbi:cytochrome b5 [Peziza echinospora]|nr:cytochrome b5 [Peziza echinospora]
MSTEIKEFTYDDVKVHDSKNDLWVVVNDKVYDITKFVDEHPGGEEVLLDVAGVDSTEAFDDVGHSDEAREILATLLVGNIKGGSTKPKPTKQVSAQSTHTSSDSGTTLYIVVFAGIVLAFAAYKYTQLA